MAELGSLPGTMAPSGRPALGVAVFVGRVGSVRGVADCSEGGCCVSLSLVLATAAAGPCDSCTMGKTGGRVLSVLPWLHAVSCSTPAGVALVFCALVLLGGVGVGVVDPWAGC